MILKIEAGVDFTLHTQMVAVDAEYGLVNYVVFAARRNVCCKAKIYIEVGVICVAGANMKRAMKTADDGWYPVQLMVILTGIGYKTDNRRLEEAIRIKYLPMKIVTCQAFGVGKT